MRWPSGLTIPAALVVLLALGLAGAWVVVRDRAIREDIGVAPVSWRPLVTPECYRLTYRDSEGDAEPGLFPGRLALIPSRFGVDSGAVFTEAHSADSIGFWQMFQFNARWRRTSGDLLEADFSNGFSSVGILAARRDSTLEGRATFYSDVVRPGPKPSMRLIGRREDCPRPATPAG